jgi:hypothetical protein
VTIDPLTGLHTSERGGTATFKVVLTGGYDPRDLSAVNLDND